MHQHYQYEKQVCNYRLVNETDEYMVIIDLGPWDEYKTITNEPEWVVAQLAPRLKGRKLYYIDSAGQTDQLLIHDGKFAGFKSGGPTT